MMNNVSIKVIQQDDIPNMVKTMKEADRIGPNYQVYFNRCHEENKSGDRVTFVAYSGGCVAGYVNIIFISGYPYFSENNIPEINDLYVVPSYRREGIGLMLIKSCEEYAAEAGYQMIGLGVGLYKDYGNAQRLYTKNGYQLDGNGLMYQNGQVSPGANILVDDDLLLYLYKELL